MEPVLNHVINPGFTVYLGYVCWLMGLLILAVITGERCKKDMEKALQKARAGVERADCVVMIIMAAGCAFLGVFFVIGGIWMVYEVMTIWAGMPK